MNMKKSCFLFQKWINVLPYRLYMHVRPTIQNLHERVELYA